MIFLFGRKLRLPSELCQKRLCRTESGTTFSLENRIKWAKDVFANYPNVEVVSYDGLTADFCKKVGARFIIRGLRSGSDFEYENMICHANKRLHPELETVFLLTESELVGVSSSVVRDIYKNGGDTSKFVPKEVVLGIEKCEAFNEVN